MLVKNILIKWLNDEVEEERVERILWIEPSRAYLYTFDLADKSALPVRRNYAEIMEALNQAQAVVVNRHDRYLLQAEEQFTKKQRQRRDENYALIEPIVQAGEAAFIPQRRGPLIEAVVKQTGRAKWQIYDYLRRYWRAGQVKNGLIPRFDQRGLKPDPALKPHTYRQVSHHDTENPRLPNGDAAETRAAIPA